MLIDSKILIYAINKSSPKHIRAQNFLQNNRNHLEVVHQNNFETIRVLTHPKFAKPMTIDNAIKAVETIIDVCTIISPDYRTHRITLELIQKYSLTSDQVFDAYLVATAMSNGITILVTDNVRDLQKFTDLTITNPFKE
jgi:predicted nucleic acid-binding protein